MKKIMEILVVLVFLVGTVFAMENRNPTNSQEEIINVQIENSEETKETVMETTNKKANLFEKICYFFKCAFADMKESTKAQHELDKANFEAVKAESRANFEENRFHNTFKKAKENSKESWENAKMSPAERTQKCNKKEKKLLKQHKKEKQLLINATKKQKNNLQKKSEKNFSLFFFAKILPLEKLWIKI